MVWLSLKFDGPPYRGKVPGDLVLCERIIVVHNQRGLLERRAEAATRHCRHSKHRKKNNFPSIISYR